MNINFFKVFTVLFVFSINPIIGMEYLYSLIPDFSQPVCPKRKEVLSEIRSRVVNTYLNVEESEGNVRTKCQKPTQQRPQNVSHCLSSGVSIPEGFFETEVWKTSQAYRNEIKRKDGRKRIMNASIWPHCVHGVVKVRYSDNAEAYGTGAVIGPNLVLTAAHNLYCEHRKERATNIVFIPSRNGTSAPLGEISVINFYIPDAYTVDSLGELNEDDFGVLILGQDVSKYTGYFGLNILPKEELMARKLDLNVIGYPSIKVEEDNKSGHHELWGMKGKASTIDDDYIYYKDSVIRTNSGQSGSVVFYEDPNNPDTYYIVGVHVLGASTKEGCNQATFLTKARFEQIQKWVLASKLCTTQLDTEEFALHGLYPRGQCNQYTSPMMQWKGKVIYGEKDNGDFLIKELIQYSFSNLKKLDLGDNSLTCEGAITLGKARLPHLECLSLRKNQIGMRYREYNMSTVFDGNWDRSGLEALSQAHWPKLVQIDLKGNYVWVEGIKILSKSIWWPRLEVLGLQNNRLGPSGVVALAEAWPLQLQKLDLGDNNCEDVGIEALDKIKNKKLVTLGLSNNNIKNKKAIVDLCYHCPTLQRIILTGNDVDDVWNDLATESETKKRKVKKSRK